MSMDDRIEEMAQVVHAANRELQRINGDPVNPPWNSLSADLKASTRKGVMVALGGSSPRSMHAAWAMERRLKGWTYGPVKDEEKKTHPQLVNYNELPEAQRVKDRVFLAIVGAMDEVPE